MDLAYWTVGPSSVELRSVHLYSFLVDTLCLLARMFAEVQEEEAQEAGAVAHNRRARIAAAILIVPGVDTGIDWERNAAGREEATWVGCIHGERMSLDHRCLQAAMLAWVPVGHMNPLFAQLADSNLPVAGYCMSGMSFVLAAAEVTTAYDIGPHNSWVDSARRVKWRTVFWMWAALLWKVTLMGP